RPHDLADHWPGGFETGHLHARGGEQSGGEELKIGGAARNRSGAARIDERPDTEAERHEVQRWLQKTRKQRAAPDVAVDNRVALDDPQGSSHRQIPNPKSQTNPKPESKS